MTLYRIRNWHKFQHFKDRKPIWVKLYRELLDDIQWHDLDPLACKCLVMLWLLASEDGGSLPPIKTIAFRLRLTENQTKTIVSKLSNWVEQSDIASISSGYQDDALETEKRREETDTEKRQISPKGSGFDPSAMSLPTKLKPETWKSWLEYRASKKKPVGEKSACEQLAFLSEQPEPNEVIRASIRNDWQGLFKLNGAANGTHRGHSESLAGRAEDAERRADAVFGKL